MVALLAIITIGVFTSVSLERVTAKSYNDRYQADLAAQNGLEAAKKDIGRNPPGTAPILPASVTSTDTFLVVRADSAEQRHTYYLAQPSTGSSPTITYYPLFSASTDPTAPGVQTQTINLAAPFAPAVPTPAPPADSSPTDPTAAWDAAKAQRLPKLYSWQQPNPSPSGPSVKWVEMRDPQDAPAPAPHNLPYTRYAYWAEDLDGYLDASQVGGQARTSGTNPQEIAMFTIFNPTPQTDPNYDGGNHFDQQAPSSLYRSNCSTDRGHHARPGRSKPRGSSGVDNNTAEQILVPLGYGYGRNDANQIGEGYPKTPINPVSQLGLNGNQTGKFGNLTTVMPNFVNRAWDWGADA